MPSSSLFFFYVVVVSPLAASPSVSFMKIFPFSPHSLLLFGQIINEDKQSFYFYSDSRLFHLFTCPTMTNTNKSYICANCNQIINDRYMLQGRTTAHTATPVNASCSVVALDKMWHEDCLKCACCDCRLGETGSTLYLKANLILCKRDYLRLFGMTGHCASCQRLSKTNLLRKDSMHCIVYDLLVDSSSI